MKVETLSSLLLLRRVNNTYAIARVIKKLKDKGFEMDIAIRNAPGGYSSEDVESFIGRLLCFGYACKRNPVRLTKKGVKLLQKIIREAQLKDPSELKNVIKSLRE